MNKNKITFYVMIVVMVLCFVSAAVFYYREDTGMGVAWMCIGIVFMISGMMWKRRSLEDKDKKDEEK